MQAYSRIFAKVYNEKWIAFAKRVAPLILSFYASTSIGKINKSVLDLCCGTGQLALYFLENGYKVVGIDLSEYMLKYARKNAEKYLSNGNARFLQADAADFTLDEHFGLVVSTFDAINHLEGEEALQGCCKSVFRVLKDDGFFIFDLNTRAGLKYWNSINITDTEEFMLVSRGIYEDGTNKAFVKITGFVRNSESFYERFEENVFNTAFDMGRVQKMLLDAGWREVYFAQIVDLATPIKEPEKENRVFIVAHK